MLKVLLCFLELPMLVFESPLVFVTSLKLFNKNSNTFGNMNGFKKLVVVVHYYFINPKIRMIWSLWHDTVIILYCNHINICIELALLSVECYIHRCKSNILKVNVDKISHKLDKIVKNHNAKGTDSDIEKKLQIIMISHCSLSGMLSDVVPCD